MLRKDELMNEKETLLNEMGEIQRSETPDANEFQARAMKVATINGKIEALVDAESEPEVRSELGPQVVVEPSKDEKDAEYRDAFVSYLRKTDGAEAQLRTMSEGVSTDGGYLVPTIDENHIHETKESAVVMRQLASVITSSNDRDLPIQGDVPSAQYIAENGTYPVGDATFGIKQFKAYKTGIIIKASEELVKDSKFDISAYLNKKQTQSFAKLDEVKFISGTGTNEAEGVLVGASTGKTAASATVITAPEVIDFIFSLGAQYSAGAKILMKKSTMGTIRTLWEANTQTFKLDFLNGQYHIEGVPVIYCESMPAIATGNAVMAYGDFSEYQIVDRLGLEVRVLGEKYADDGQVGYRFTSRTDGKLLTADAVKLFKMA